MEGPFPKLVSLHDEVRSSKEYVVIKDIKENETSFRLSLRNYQLHVLK